MFFSKYSSAASLSLDTYAVVAELIVPGLSYICVPMEAMLSIEGLHGEPEEEEEEEEEEEDDEDLHLLLICDLLEDSV